VEVSFLLFSGLERITLKMTINVNVVGISKRSRSLFLELDATARTQQQQQQQQPPVLSPLPKDDSRRKSREVRK
jgi:hypothetical protein